MSKIGGSANTVIEAPLDQVYPVASDIEGSVHWQPAIEVAECIERDGKGNQTLVHMETDVKVRQLGSKVRFNYDEENRISWTQEDGDLKSVEGSWELEDLGDGQTRVTYQLEVDLGRRLGLLVRGPLVGVLRGHMIDSMPEKMKRFIEGDET